jgi:(4-O-methyl)-D-glucuronate---lignin esterase
VAAGLVEIVVAVVATAVSIAAVSARTRQAASHQPPVELTAEQDHRRLMDLLGITSIRRGPSGNPQAPDAANFDESKANPYPTLPDPLVMKDGTPVKTAAAWWQKRRAEIVEDFDREIYGRTPVQTPAVKWEILSTTEEVNGDVPGVTKKLRGHVDNSAYPLISVDIDLTLTTPAKAKGPVPVMIEFGWVFPGGRTPPGLPPPPPGPTWQQQVLANGWGYAILIPTSVQADNGAGLTRGIIGLVNKGQPRQVDEWGALRAWAWGASSALDYLERKEPSTRSRWASRGCLAMARLRSSRWPTTSASRSGSSARPARAAQSCTAGTSANKSKTSPVPASITGWPATSSNTLDR